MSRAFKESGATDAMGKLLTTWADAMATTLTAVACMVRCVWSLMRSDRRSIVSWCKCYSCT